MEFDGAIFGSLGDFDAAGLAVSPRLRDDEEEDFDVIPATVQNTISSNGVFFNVPLDCWDVGVSFRCRQL